MPHKPEDVGITEDEALEASRKMTFILLTGPENWEKIRPKLIETKHLPQFRKIAELSPERMDRNFIEHVRVVGHAIVDAMATNFELWAMAQGRDDLLKPLGEKLAEAEREATTEQ